MIRQYAVVFDATDIVIRFDGLGSFKSSNRGRSFLELPAQVAAQRSNAASRAKSFVPHQVWRKPLDGLQTRF